MSVSECSDLCFLYSIRNPSHLRSLLEVRSLGSTPRVSDSVSECLRSCISNNFPDDVGDVDLRTTLNIIFFLKILQSWLFSILSRGWLLSIFEKLKHRHIMECNVNFSCIFKTEKKIACWLGLIHYAPRVPEPDISPVMLGWSLSHATVL